MLCSADSRHVAVDPERFAELIDTTVFGSFVYFAYTAGPIFNLQHKTTHIIPASSAREKKI